MKKMIYSLVVIAILILTSGCNLLKFFPVEIDYEYLGTDYESLWPDRDMVEYYDTLEEAVANNDMEICNISHIDEIVRLFQDDKNAILFFKSNWDGKDGLWVYRLYKKEKNGETIYSAPFAGIDILWETHKYFTEFSKLDEIGEVRMCIVLYSDEYLFGIDNTKRFFYGLSQTEKISSLKIEEQLVTEVIPVEFNGEIGYFWYINDLQTSKSSEFRDLRRHLEGEMNVTMD